jgi:hypothetical protein
MESMAHTSGGIYRRLLKSELRRRFGKDMVEVFFVPTGYAVISGNLWPRTVCSAAERTGRAAP